MKSVSIKPAVVALLVGLSTSLPAPLTLAQPKPGYMPSSTHIFPAGGQRGTTVRVRVGAECLPPGANFYLQGSGVHAPDVLGAQLVDDGERSPRRSPTEIPITHPRQWESRIEIAADAPLGPATWRLSCAQGGTGSRPFVVGEWPEFIERESNSSPDRAERVSLPVTLNGQIHGERDADYFQFLVSPGSVVVCEVLAGRLGSRLDPIVEILDPRGQTVVPERQYFGSDPVLAFRADSSEPYLLRVANVSVDGSPAHVYRIHLTTSPYVRCAFPSGGQAGSEQDVELFVMSGGDRPATSQRKIKLSPAVGGWFEYRAAEFANSVLFAVDDLPNLVEREPNDRSAAMDLSWPVTVHGRLAAASDEDWFVLSAGKDERLTLECHALPLGSLAWPALLLVANDGNELAQARSVDASEGVARIEWNSPAEGRYRVRVRDLQFGSAGGDDFIYRLSIRRPRPDFELSLASDCVNVLQGGDVTVEVMVRRFGGFDGPIDLQSSGLPETVKADGAQIPANAAVFKLNIKASADTPANSYTFQVKGTATIAGQLVEHVARGRHLGVDNEGIGLGPPALDRLHLIVQHKPVFRLFCSEAYLYAHRGSVFPYLMEVERLEGFDGPITLQIGDRQNRDLDGIEMREVVIPPGQTQIRLPIYLPETMHINVQSQSQLYCQGYATFTDKHQRGQSVLVLSEKRNMLRTLPPVVKLKALDGELVMGPEGELTCRFRIERTSNFPGPLQLELLDAPPRSRMTAEPIMIAAGQTDVSMRLGNTAPPTEPVTLKFRATGKMTDGTLIITEDQVTVRR